MRSSVLAALVLASFAVIPSEATTKKTDPTPEEIGQIIQKFAANEAAFARARESYTYTQSFKMQEFDDTGTPHGKFERTEEILFDKNGRRLEKVVKAPMPTLRLLTMTAEDEQDLRNVMPFVLTSAEIDNYHVRYLGTQQVDEISTYVFAVKPKTMEVGKRYFQGQIWVDDKDLMIVKTYGRAGGVAGKKGFEQQFPKFETYREQIDGKYWFPTFTSANSLLHFPAGDIRLKMNVRYADYKQFKADVNIIYGDEATPEQIKKGDPNQTVPAPPPAK